MQMGPNPFDRMEIERQQREAQEQERQQQEEEMVGEKIPRSTSLTGPLILVILFILAIIVSLLLVYRFHFF